VLKRGSIDKYIQQVTAGLPQLERIDTAAELRVHLLQKTRELMAQGFPREEAEHLAVQEMGPVSETNRALLGHIFTAKFGWGVLGFVALTIVAWIGWNFRYVVFWPQAEIQQSEITAPELSRAFRMSNIIGGGHLVFNLKLPQGTKYFLVNTWKYSRQSSPEIGGLNMTLDEQAKPEPETLRLIISEGRSFEEQGRSFYFIYGSGRLGGIAGTTGKTWTRLPNAPWRIESIERKTIELNKWIPIAIYTSFTNENTYPRDAAIIGILASDIDPTDRSNKAQTARNRNLARRICLGGLSISLSKIEIVPAQDKTSIPQVANDCSPSR
jgi:hypothetical protein